MLCKGRQGGLELWEREWILMDVWEKDGLRECVNNTRFLCMFVCLLTGSRFVIVLEVE